MTRTTNKELEARVNKMENDFSEMKSMLSEIVKNMSSINEAVNGKASTPKSKSTKTEGKVKNSKKATTCKYEVVEGQGKGQGKKFVQITFDGKPSDKVLESLKSHGFKYFAPTKVWSTHHTDAKVEFAKSLIK